MNTRIFLLVDPQVMCEEYHYQSMISCELPMMAAYIKDNFSLMI
jgi:hypothetical protein